MNMNKLVAAVATFLGTLAVLVAVGWLLWQFISPRFDVVRERYNPNIIPFHVHFGYDEDTLHIVFEGERVRGVPAPVLYADEAHLPVEFVRVNIDPFMFWDSGAQLLFVTTRYEMRSWRVGDVRLQGGEVFVPASVIMELYYFTVAFHPQYNMVVVTDDRTPQRAAQVTGAAPVRYRPDPAAPMTTRLPSGEGVTVFGEYGAWTRVRTGEGLLGYVQTSSLGERAYKPQPLPRASLFATGFVDNFAPNIPTQSGKINLVWDVSWNTANPLPGSLTVVSPTWFRFCGDTMGVVSVAGAATAAAYVNWAHEQGVQVWANVTDVYASPARSYPHIGHLLRDANARRRAISQLTEHVEELNLDGLVINIESLHLFRYGPYFVQFMRELNIALGRRIVLSAAMLADPAVNPHYRHDLIARTIDFIILMTYDEHHGYSPQPGPTASLPWVDRQISTMLRLVPAHQLLMGLPFYNRVWRSAVADESRRGTLNWSMDWTEDRLGYHTAERVWDDVIGSYYAEFMRVEYGETIRHQIWLECPRSIAMKMQIYAVYNLAGVAGWHLGFANETAWAVIGAYFR